MFCGDAARRLAPVPGISPINVTALVAAVGNANTFVHGRDLALQLRHSIWGYLGLRDPL